jgi:biopolymer transport protein ExbD
MSYTVDTYDEPNLTPLLDLVLQMVMFFMLVVHFENEQKNEKVKLPAASIAKALTKDHSKVLFINQLPDTGDSETENRPSQRSLFTVFEKTAMRELTTLPQLKVYLQNQYERDEALTKKEDWAAGKGRSLVILRADKGCTFKQVYDVMTTVRSVGYTEIQLRAELKGRSDGKK